MKINPPKPVLVKLILLSLAACVLAWCQGCDAQNGGLSQKKLHLAFVANTPNDFWSVVQLGCNTAARQSGNVDLDFRFPVKPTVEAQNELVSNLVASGVDGIALSPIDPERQTEFLNGIAAKTLLVCADSDAEKSKRVCFIGTDNVAAGRQAAALLKEALPQGGKVVLFVSYLNAENTKDRIQGLQAGLAGANIQVVDTLADGAKSAVAQQNAEDVLAKYPDLAGIVCLNGYQGPAALAAVLGAGKAGKVQMVCFEGYSDTLDGIAAGDIFGTVMQMPYNLGYQTISRMEKQLRGDATQLGQGNVLLPSKQLTKDSVADYQANLKNLILKLKNDQN